MKISTIRSDTSFWEQSQILEIVLLLGLSVAIPFLVHLAPSPAWGALPLGALLLPMFYTPLLAVLFCRTHVGIMVCLAGPWLNLQLTGYPEPAFALVLTTELLIFYLFLKGLAVRRKGRWQWYFAPFSFLAAKGLMLVLVLVWPALLPRIAPLAFFLNSTIYALPGLVILSLIGSFAIRWYPPEPSVS